MHATIQWWGRPLIPLIALAALAACSTGREPPYDGALAGEVTRLTAETLRLFQDLRLDADAGYDDRTERYRDLAVRAETVRLMAEARGSAAAPGRIPLLLAGTGADLSLADGVTAEATARLAEYADATPSYMADYLRNLTDLEALDAAATGSQAERHAAHQSALAAHRAAVEAYLIAFGAWQHGAGPRPEQPAKAPPPPAAGLDPAQLVLRRTALEDILRDVLIYERDLLNRNR